MNIREANNPFSDGVKALILNRGLKQTHVATKAGYTPQELSDMLNGRKLIKACDIPRIAKVLESSPDDIYEMSRRVQAEGKEGGICRSINGCLLQNGKDD